MCSVCGDPTPQPQAQSLGSANTHSFSSLRDRGPSLEGLENGPAGASRQGKAGLEHSLFHPGRLSTPSSLSAFLGGRHVTERHSRTAPSRLDPISPNV